MCCLLVLVALAPFRRTVSIETQRGDQGGLQAHDTCQARPGMKQEATLVDEKCQAVHLQLGQATTDEPCADWQAEGAEHAPVKHARECRGRATLSSDQDSAPDSRQKTSLTDAF